jgi:TfoX/Sxy family transcriptional regulator of competence genes
MPYNSELADKVRLALAQKKGVQEKKMFGGIAFMIDGVMGIGVDKDDLIIRCEKDETDALLEKKGVRVFDLSGGRPMKGWLLVGPEATATARGLKQWIDFALERAESGGKTAAKPRPKRATRTK